MKAKAYFAGVDPAASSKKWSGLAVVDRAKRVVFLGRWKTFDDLLSILHEYQPGVKLIGVDGPLQPPYDLGRCCFTSESSSCGHRQQGERKGRYCENVLIQNGYRCFLTSRNSFIPSWVYRCFILNDFLKEHGFSTLEVFPYAARKILFPDLVGKKQHRQFREALQTRLRQWGLIFPDSPKLYSHDELDAMMAAITVFLHTQKKTQLVGDEKDGFICIPVER